MCLIVPYAENLYGFTLTTPAVGGLVYKIAPVNNPHQVKHDCPQRNDFSPSEVSGQHLRSCPP